MSDFIREVDEDYRRDRIVNFLTKNQTLLIALVVAIVLGTAGYRVYLHYQTQAAEAANARYDAALQLVRDGKTGEAQAAFDAMQGSAPPGYAILARMKAVEALATRDPAAGARGFDAIAGDTSVDGSIRDTAQLRGAMIRVDIDDPKAFDARYAPFATSGFAYRASMRELLALAALKRDDTAAAGRWLDEIVVDPQAPSALRGRAEAFLSLVAAGPATAGVPEPAKPVVPMPPTATPLTMAPPSATPATPPAAPTTATPKPEAPSAPGETPAAK